METAIIGTTINSAYPWVVDRGEVHGQFVGLLNAVGGQGDVGGEVGGGRDRGVVGSCDRVEGKVCAELGGILAVGMGWGREGKGERKKRAYAVAG